MRKIVLLLVICFLGLALFACNEELPNQGTQGTQETGESFFVNTFSNTDEYGNAGTYTKLKDAQYKAGEMLDLKATVREGYNFEGWYRNGVCMSKSPIYSFAIPEENINLEARFSYYTVTVECYTDDYGNAGTYTKKDKEKVSEGETVRLKATVEDGYNFEGWFIGNVCVSTDLQYEFVMEKENRKIVPKYSYYTFTTTAYLRRWSSLHGFEEMMGTYSKYNKEKVSCGEQVTLKVTVADGYTFEGWFINGVCVSKDLEYTYSMEKKNVEISARYTYNTISTVACLSVHNITTAFEDYMGTYTKYDEQKIRIGETVTLKATVKSGYRFLGWRRGFNMVSTDLVYTFVMREEDVTFEAVFEKVG